MLVTKKKKKLLWSYFSKFSHLKIMSWKRSKGKTLSSTVAENFEVYLIYIHFSWEIISRFANSVCIWSYLTFHGLAVGLSITPAFTAKQNEPRGWSPRHSTGSCQSWAVKSGQPGPSLCPHPDGILCMTPRARSHHWPGPWHWPHHPLPTSHRQASLQLLVRNVYCKCTAPRVLSPTVQPHVYSAPVYSPTCTQSKCVQPHVYSAPRVQPHVYSVQVYSPTCTQPHVYSPRCTQPHTYSVQVYSPTCTQPHVYSPRCTQPQVYSVQV